MEEKQVYTESVDMEPINVEVGNSDDNEDANNQQLINIIITLANGGKIETSRWYPNYVFGREKEIMQDIMNEVINTENSFPNNKFVKIDNISVRADRVIAIKTTSMISSDTGWQEDIPTAELLEEDEEVLN